MAKAKQQKAQEITGAGDRLGRMVGAVLADMTGVKVRDLEDLRRQARAASCEYVVVKKTLLTRAAGERGVPFDPQAFAGSVSVLFGFADAVSPAKIAKTFAKAQEKFRVLGGWLREGAGVRTLSLAEVQRMGDLPSRDELVARAVGSIAAPLRGLVGVLQGNLHGLVQVLTAVRNAKG